MPHHGTIEPRLADLRTATQQSEGGNSTLHIVGLAWRKLGIYSLNQLSHNTGAKAWLQ